MIDSIYYITYYYYDKRHYCRQKTIMKPNLKDTKIEYNRLKKEMGKEKGPIYLPRVECNGEHIKEEDLLL